MSSSCDFCLHQVSADNSIEINKLVMDWSPERLRFRDILTEVFPDVDVSLKFII